MHKRSRQLFIFIMIILSQISLLVSLVFVFHGIASLIYAPLVAKCESGSIMCNNPWFTCKDGYTPYGDDCQWHDNHIFCADGFCDNKYMLPGTHLYNGIVIEELFVLVLISISFSVLFFLLLKCLYKHLDKKR